jgi:hypothetical protein
MHGFNGSRVLARLPAEAIPSETDEYHSQKHPDLVS